MKTIKFKKSLIYLILSLSSALVFSTVGFAANNTHVTLYEPNIEANLTEQASNFTDAELEQMLAPIALYPDALLSHILIATTYPIEVIDAERWLNKNSLLSTQALADAAEDKDWDPSVKALLPFPNIVKKLSEDLHLMRNLGDAFLQNEAQLLASVQRLRQQADQAGNLANMDNVNVVRKPQTIIIESRQPDIIYVPYYDTRVVYGDWRWSHYPPIFWHRPMHYASQYGPYYWHNPVHLTVGLFFGSMHWNNHHVVVNHHKSRYYKHHSNKKTSTSYQVKRWQHNPRHRKGVAYRTANIQKKYRSHTPSVQQHKALRVKQKHFVNKNKHRAEHAGNKYTHSRSKGQSQSQSQNLKHKLQVNRAVKIDKHPLEKNSLIKHKAYKNKHWQQSNSSKKTYNDKVKTTKSINSAAKLHANMNKNSHDRVKNNIKKDNYKQSNQVITNRGHTKRSYVKAVKAPKRNDQHNQASTNVKRMHKRSNAKVTRSRKNSASRTRQNRAKQHN
ncbi:DUF3300 domain-containing protein [Colwellia sp. C1TZA3]|uniref:DUF3300 domain-containing protein n=1 Tax=Colwellia sp. C1TZA3 TaxID=2508879 RepID=UPI0011BA28D3|nr:DUF3300 domain-containing protein [Colwellia sp. C1TZA3]TWX73907.1 DUF3300 domain-containing protein [Colwellia sp. C1TZA3]